MTISDTSTMNANNTNITESSANHQPVLTVKQLKRHYTLKSQSWFGQPALLKALDGVSFQLQPRKTLAVVGESGCGKSTLARVLTMIEPETAGDVLLEGKNVGDLSARERKQAQQSIQMIFQNPYGSLNPRKKIGTILEEPLLLNTKMTATERKSRAYDLLVKVGLRTEHYDRYPHMFSGGQRQRIAIARGLMMRPKVVVADEPVSALDVSVQAQVLNLMMDLQDEYDLAYVFISHDLSVVEHIADDVMVMYLGKVVEYGEKSQVFSAPKHPYTRALLSATPRIQASQRGERIQLSGELPSPINPPKGCAFSARCQYANDRCHSESPVLQAAESGHSIACFGVDEARLDYLIAKS